MEFRTEESGRIEVQTGIICPETASDGISLAARELQRYIYLRSGEMLPITKTADAGPRILFSIDTSLKEEQYCLLSNGIEMSIIGGSDTAVLYGTYHFVEKTGIQFQLDEDIIPDEQEPFVLPELDEIHQPIFKVRGIQPFHDFAQGPDWWSTDDYLRYITGLARMRMNFIGFHNYPPGRNGMEPLIWIGKENDFDPESGKVKRSYQTYWANTGIYSWHHAIMNTSDFAAGVSCLFDKDEYGSPVFDGIPKQEQTPKQSNEVFRRVGIMLEKAFSHARRLGVKSCVGTQSPINSPNEDLKELSKKDIFRGIFSRIKATHPLDYYWIWTPETWTLKGSDPKEFNELTNEIKAALEALDELGNPFKLATSGWVLGPADDRAALDKVLSKDVTLSSINRNVGHQSVDASYGIIQGRPKWAIPWLENDANMIGPQPWVGRMRRDAADARHFG